MSSPYEPAATGPRAAAGTPVLSIITFVLSAVAWNAAT